MTAPGYVRASRFLAGGGDLLRLTPTAAADLYGVDKSVVHRWARDGKVRRVAYGLLEVPAPALTVSARPPRTRVAPFVRLEGDELLGTTGALSAALGVDPRTIDRWVKAGKASSAAWVVRIPVGPGSWVHRSRSLRARVAELRRRPANRSPGDDSTPKVRPVDVRDEGDVVEGPVEQVAAYLGLTVRALRALAGATETEDGVRVQAVPVAHRRPS